ncbi:hypothetical protein U3516DRAFT_779418 [Neocallimastix sp. 'constans']
MKIKQMQNNILDNENDNEKEKEKENMENAKTSIYDDPNSEKEITERLNGKFEFTEKMMLMTAYYFVYKIMLSIETNLEVRDIVNYLNNDKIQSEIDFARNIDHERSDWISIAHDITFLLDCSNFVLDYLFYLLLNFEFQKPYTPSLETIFDIADGLVKNSFFVAAKTDRLPRLVIIINHLMFSVSENFKVEYIGSINSDLHLVFDLINLRERKIRKCLYFSNLQNFIKMEMNSENKNLIPNDSIIISDGASTYIYKIKTRNTVDFRFDGLDIINDAPFNKHKWISNSLNTFNNIILASFQKINIGIFLPDSNTLMSAGNGRDIHKWKHFRKIACVEPDSVKFKNLE